MISFSTNSLNILLTQLIQSKYCDLSLFMVMKIYSKDLFLHHNLPIRIVALCAEFSPDELFAICAILILTNANQNWLSGC